jgi:cytochrome P450
MLESFPLLYTFTYLPWVKFGALLGFIDTSAISKRIEYHHWIYSRSKERMEQDTDRPDFMSHILKHNGDKGLSMSQDEINSNCQLFVTAGSETTATLLSGVTFLLLKNPSVHQKLKAEVRSRWKNYSDITIEEVNKAPYLLAVLSEALRYFPPVPTGFPRQTPPGGAVVSGHYIPEKTSVYVSSYALGHSERNFKNPEFFVPERWMGDPEYADDRRNAHQPFSFGPRNCLGKVSFRFSQRDSLEVRAVC